MSSARAPPEPSGDLSIRVSVQRPTRGRSIDALRPHLIQEWEYFALPQPELIKYKMKLESAYLLHLFWHPEDALPKSPLWRGLPRKIKDKLRCKDEDPKIGWGFSVEYEWDWVTFTFLMVPFILIDFAIVAALSAHYQWPVATAFTVAMGPVTVIAFVNTMMSSITKQKGLSK
jgi:hypothetical protein